MNKKLFLGLLSLCLIIGIQAERTVYVSLVKKGTVHSCLNRLATSNHHIVATLQPVPNAIKSIELKEQEGQSICLVEAFSHMAPRLFGEKARFHNIIVVELPKKEAMGHTHYPGMPSIYMEKVAKKSILVEPKISQKSMILLRSFADIKTDFIQIDKNYLRQKVSELSGAVSVKVGKNIVKISERRSTTGRNNAREYLRQEYEKIGFSVSYHQYDTGWYKGANIIAEKKGQDPNKYFIVSAHMDTVNTAGADDDATGIVCGMAIANALKDVPLKYTLRIVGFDHEEVGLVGSKAYASHLNQKGELNNMIGLIQMEMMGYDGDSDGGFHVIDCNENTSSQITDLVMKTVLQQKIKLTQVAGCTTRSDHASFWRYNKPAIVISQNFFGGDASPCYHRSCDKLDMINFDYMHKITIAVAKTVANIVVQDEKF